MEGAQGTIDSPREMQVRTTGDEVLGPSKNFRSSYRGTGARTGTTSYSKRPDGPSVHRLSIFWTDPTKPTRPVKKNFLKLFSPVLWTAKQVQGESSHHRKVHSVEHLQRVFEFSGYKVAVALYNKQQHIKDWRGLAEHQTYLLSTLLNEAGIDTFPFEVENYLNNISVSVQELIATQGMHALCYPKRDNDLLMALINDYHTCKFLEQHRNEFDDAVFISRTRNAKSNLIRSAVRDTFYWTGQLDLELFQCTTFNR